MDISRNISSIFKTISVLKKKCLNLCDKYVLYKHNFRNMGLTVQKMVSDLHGFIL